MLKPALSSVVEVMQRLLDKHASIAGDGGRSVGIEDVFPFQPEEVAGIHVRMAGGERGVWFRLKDGRVFNSYGQPAPADPSLYDRD